ncbi:uncharacterized protein LOC111374806 [Olea europaea var. sylvestris]|uniref:uncharacterized protein LOC111374806 n=1 Tax=Olea europaea var. sylvestris TaxID=158386 RepID=UPI000C1D1B84|nr:uncharacterized protein LOC111374806 [Olea europaea var. sylvestris]
MKIDESGEHRKLQIQELEQIRNDAYESARFYKEKMKAFHDKMISRKEFRIGQKVLLYHSRLQLFLVEIQSLAISKVFKVNGHRLKPFYDSIQVEELQHWILKIQSIPVEEGRNQSNQRQ